MEIIPQKPHQYSIWFNVLLYAALVVFIVVLVIFFILNNSVKNSQKDLKSLEDDLRKEDTAEKAGLKKELAGYQRKINDFSKLIDQHVSIIESLELIKRDTHPKAWFSMADINSRQGTISLSGQTQSFESLGQQLIALRKESVIKSVSLEKVAIGKIGSIDFGLSISLSPEIFKPFFTQSQ